LATRFLAVAAVEVAFRDWLLLADSVEKVGF